MSELSSFPIEMAEKSSMEETNYQNISKNRIMVCNILVVIFCEEQDDEQGGNRPWITLLGGVKND